MTTKYVTIKMTIATTILTHTASLSSAVHTDPERNLLPSRLRFGRAPAQRNPEPRKTVLYANLRTHGDANLGTRDENPGSWNGEMELGGLGQFGA